MNFNDMHIREFVNFICSVLVPMTDVLYAVQIAVVFSEIVPGCYSVVITDTPLYSVIANPTSTNLHHRSYLLHLTHHNYSPIIVITFLVTAITVLKPTSFIKPTCIFN